MDFVFVGLALLALAAPLARRFPAGYERLFPQLAMLLMIALACVAAYCFGRRDGIEHAGAASPVLHDWLGAELQRLSERFRLAMGLALGLMLYLIALKQFGGRARAQAAEHIR